MVISYTLWRRRFHGDPSAIGRAIALNGNNYTIVGVMPPGFRFPEFPDADVDLWRTLTMNPATRRGPFYSTGIARLKPDVRREDLRADLDDFRRPQTQLSWADPLLTAIPQQESLVGGVKPILYAPAGAVALLLLIATANVATLLLARAAARDREIALALMLSCVSADRRERCRRKAAACGARSASVRRRCDSVSVTVRLCDSVAIWPRWAGGRVAWRGRTAARPAIESRPCTR